MNTSGLADSSLTPQSWNNVQLEQFSLLMAAASQMSGALLPHMIPGMPCNTVLGNHFPGSASNSATVVDLNRTVQFPLHNADYRSSGRSIMNLNSTNLLTPDGKSPLRYPEPDIKSLVFDPAVGYRFDQSTGLHYDANSGLFVNKKRGILLKYEKLTNTYERAGTTSDIVAPVLVRELAELLGYDETPQTNASPMHQTNASPKTLPDVPPDQLRDEFARVKERSASYEEMSPVPSPRLTSSRRDQSQSPAKDKSSRYNSNLNQMNSAQDDVPSRNSRRRRGRSRSSSSFGSNLDYDHDEIKIKRKRGHTKRELRNYGSSDEDEYSPSSRRKRSRTRSSPRKISDHLYKSKSESKERNKGNMTLPDALDVIAQIHQRNVKTRDNLSGRFFPSNYKDCSQMCSILVTPLPPKGDREWKELEILVKGITKANGFRVESVKVFAKDGNTPFNHCFIRFTNSHDARSWYLLNGGTLEIANPDRSKFKSFLYLSNEYWECVRCKNSNFPLRSFCYGCFRHRAKLLRPLYESGFDTNCVGIFKLDCRIASVDDVLESLPPLDSYGIKSCELMAETNGLCLGVCIFKITDKTKAKDFLDLLLAANLNAAFVTMSSRIGLSYNPRPLSCGSNESNREVRADSNRHSMTQTSLTNPKDLGEFILQNVPVDSPSRNIKGTQTVLTYKCL